MRALFVLAILTLMRMASAVGDSEIVGYTTGLLMATPGGVDANVSIHYVPGMPVENGTVLIFSNSLMSPTPEQCSKYILKYLTIGEEVIQHYPKINEIWIFINDRETKEERVNVMFYAPTKIDQRS